MNDKSLYVLQPDARVHLQDGQIAVSRDKAVLERVPAQEVARVLLFGGAQITTQAILALLRVGAQVAFFSPGGAFRAQVAPPESGNVFVRMAQHARFGDAAFRLDLARSLIAEKVEAARQHALRFARNHPEDAAPMREVAARLESGGQRVLGAGSLDELRGFEGAAAAAWFEAFARMVRPPFRFERRSKHPARDAVNALLNLGYVMLTNEIAGRLEAAGFDPRVGYFHGIRYGRSSLALDMIEPHRVDVVDRLVLSTLNRRVFEPGDFEDHGEADGVRLRSAALKRFLGLYEEALGSPAAGGSGDPRRRLQDQVIALRARVMAGHASVDVRAELIRDTAMDDQPERVIAWGEPPGGPAGVTEPRGNGAQEEVDSAGGTDSASGATLSGMRRGDGDA